MVTSPAHAVVVLAALSIAWSMPAAAATATSEQAYRPKRDAAREAYEQRLYLLARTALENGLGEDGLMSLREILVRDPEHARAREMSRKLEAFLARRGTPRMTEPERRAYEGRRQSMQTLADRERQKFVATIATLAAWCSAGKYEPGLRECITDGLALDTDCAALRALNGEKRHQLYGWLEAAVVDHMSAGEWLEDGAWKPWSEISARRIEALKKLNEGEAFSYSATYHFTFASDLKDKNLEKDLRDALETLVREQYRKFYSDFRAGIKPHNVVYFEAKKDFQAYTARRGHSFTDAMGIYVAPERTLYAWRHDGDMTNGVGTVFHEATHGTLHDLFEGAKLPIWLNEGLASFHEKSRPADNDFRFGPINIPRMGELKKALEGGAHVTLDEVFSLDAAFGQRLMYSYNLSAMFIHFLYSRGLLKPFIKEVLAHGDPLKAVRNVLGPDQSAWDKVFDAYVHDELLDPAAIRKMSDQMKGTRLQ